MRILLNNIPQNIHIKRNMVQKNVSGFSIANNSFSQDIVSFSSKNLFEDKFNSADRSYLNKYDSYTAVPSYQLSEEECNEFLGDFLTNFNTHFDRKYMFMFSGNLPIEVLRDSFVRPRYRDYQTEICHFAGIKSIDDYLKAAHIYNAEKTYEIFENSAVNFLEIYSCLDDKQDLEKFPEFLYYLNLKAEYNSISDKKEFFNHYTKILNKLNVRSSNELHTKYNHLSGKFNNFENFDDDIKALDYINEQYQQKIDLLRPVSEKFSSNKRLDAPEKIYSQIPDIVDYLSQEKLVVEFEDFLKYVPIAVSSDKFSSNALHFVSDTFNDFQSPEDKISFFKKLNKQNLSISEFNKLYDNSIVEFKTPISKINNMLNIIDSISQNDGFNKQKARDFYLKFPDVLNAAYISETKEFDAVSETINYIKRFNISDSKNFLNTYNNCNATKKNTLTPNEIIEFIDLMRFADSSTVQVNKKYKKSIFEDLRQIKDKYLSIRDDIDNFLLSKGEEFFVSESSLSIFNKYRKHLVNCSSQQINKKLNEIVKFNITSEEEYSRISQDLKNFSTYFQTKDDLYKFISDNDVPFEAGKTNDEYRQNCLYFLTVLYDDNDRETSLTNIQKLSDSKFLLNSKASLSTFKNDWFFNSSHKDVLNLFVDKKVPSYQSFKEMYSLCRTNKSNYSDLITLLQKLPNDAYFNEFVDLFRMLQYKIGQTNYPIKLDVSNAQKLSYEDFVSSVQSFDPVIINKLLGCDESINPASCIPNIKTYYMDDIDALQVAIELVNEEFSYGEKYDDLFRILNLDRDSLGLSKNASKFAYINAVTKNVPVQFMKFVNSISKINDEKNYNMSIHSVLRLIERFLAPDAKDINKLCSPHKLRKANEVLACVYEQCPYDIKYDDKTHDRMVIKNKFNGMPITSVFSKEGKMITIFDDWQ